MNAVVENIKRKTKAEIATDKIEAAIVNCELQPGTVIVEADLTEWLGLGRTPVREALVSLSSANLIRLSRGGVVIPELNAHTMLKLLELREPIEKLCLAKAVERFDTNDQAEFERLHSTLERIETPQMDAFMEVLWDIHRAIAKASQNEFIHSALKTTQCLSRRYWRYFASDEDQTKAMKIYLAMLKSLMLKDQATALEQSENLMMYLRDFTMKSIHENARVGS